MTVEYISSPFNAAAVYFFSYDSCAVDIQVAHLESEKQGAAIAEEFIDQNLIPGLVSTML